jgi:hypothetical protein
VLPQFTTGVFNQRRWPRAGDVDDCWAVADLMAVHSVAPWLRLPNMTQYRAAANNPDRDGPTPGTVAQSGLAIRTLWDEFGKLIDVVENEPFKDVLPRIKAGRPASIGVLSDSLPERLQFGFSGPKSAHRVAVFWTGTELKLANPLARAHSRPKPIGEEELHVAVRDHPLVMANCVLMPTVAQAFATHPLHTGLSDPSEIDDIDDSPADIDLIVIIQE